jgi:hypothetical protein
MKHRAFILASLLLALSSAAFALDLNGKWKGTLSTPNGDIDNDIVFKVDGEKITGTVSNMYGEEQITEGVVKGDEVSFIVMAGGGQFRIVYKGKIDGETVKFHVVLGEFGESDMVVKRAG